MALSLAYFMCVLMQVSMVTICPYFMCFIPQITMIPSYICLFNEYSKGNLQKYIFNQVHENSKETIVTLYLPFYVHDSSGIGNYISTYFICVRAQISMVNRGFPKSRCAVLNFNNFK